MTCSSHRFGRNDCRFALRLLSDFTAASAAQDAQRNYRPLPGMQPLDGCVPDSVANRR